MTGEPVDIDQLLGLLALLPPWAVHLLAYSALLALTLALVIKPIAVRIAPPEQWPAWVRALFAVLDVAAANSATIWRLVQLGTTKRALQAATLPPPEARVSSLLELDEAGRALSHPLDTPISVEPWAESVPPPPEPPPLPPKGGAR